jgi:zinc protease
MYTGDYGGVFSFSINFSCTTSNADKGVSCMTDEINNLRKHGPSPEILENTKSALLNQYKNSTRSSIFWSIYLSDQVLYQADLQEIADYKKHIDAMTIDTIREAADEYLNKSNYMQFIQLPAITP